MAGDLCYKRYGLFAIEGGKGRDVRRYNAGQIELLEREARDWDPTSRDRADIRQFGRNVAGQGNDTASNQPRAASSRQGGSRGKKQGYGPKSLAKRTGRVLQAAGHNTMR